MGDISKINKYFASPRYHSVTRLMLHFINDASAKYLEQNPQFTINSMVRSFPRLSMIGIIFSPVPDFYRAVEGNSQTPNFLQLFYNILSLGKTNKILRMQCYGESDACNNNLALLYLSALKSVETLNITGYFDQGSPSNLLDHQFDSVEIQLEPQTRDEQVAFDWTPAFIKKIANHANFFLLYLDNLPEPGSDDLVYWNEFVQNIIDSNEASLHYLRVHFKIESFYFDSSRRTILDFENHLKIWSQIDENVMKRIGMQYIDIKFDFCVLPEWKSMEQAEEYVDKFDNLRFGYRNEVHSFAYRLINLE